MRFTTSATAIMAALVATATAAALPKASRASHADVATTTLAPTATPTLATPKNDRSFSLPPLEQMTPGIHRFTHDAFGRPNITRIGELDTVEYGEGHDENGDSLVKRVNTWTGCEDYSFTSTQMADVPNAWNSLYNWAATAGSGGYSPWIDGHYFAFTSSGTFAYLCQWGSGNHAGTIEINTAHSVVSNVCYGPGMYQWNEWKKGLGVAAVGQNWCNGQSYY